MLVFSALGSARLTCKSPATTRPPPAPLPRVAPEPQATSGVHRISYPWTGPVSRVGVGVNVGVSSCSSIVLKRLANSPASVRHAWSLWRSGISKQPLSLRSGLERSWRTGIDVSGSLGLALCRGEDVLQTRNSKLVRPVRSSSSARTNKNNTKGADLDKAHLRLWYHNVL